MLQYINCNGLGDINYNLCYLVLATFMLLINFAFMKILVDRNVFEFPIDINKLVLLFIGFRLVTLGDQRKPRRKKLCHG